VFGLQALKILVKGTIKYNLLPMMSSFWAHLIPSGPPAGVLFFPNFVRQMVWQFFHKRI
jgi:hypothetical protein